MMIEKPDRVHSTVRQSFSHGRSRLVQVEKIFSTKERPSIARNVDMQIETKVLPVNKQKPKKTNTTPNKRKKVKIKIKGKSRKQPSFSNSTSSNSRIVVAPTKLTKFKKSKGKATLSTKWTTRTTLSAGLPGNEDVDPPRRRSTSTPAERWLNQIGSKR